MTKSDFGEIMTLFVDDDSWMISLYSRLHHISYYLCYIGKATRLRTVTSKWFPAMSAVCTCISGSSQAFPKPECSYSKWERSRGSPNTTTIFPTYIFMKDDELSKIWVPPHSPLPPNTHLHQNCWCRGGNQGTAGQS